MYRVVNLVDCLLVTSIHLLFCFSLLHSMFLMHLLVLRLTTIIKLLILVIWSRISLAFLLRSMGSLLMVLCTRLRLGFVSDPCPNVILHRDLRHDLSLWWTRSSSLSRLITDDQDARAGVWAT